jgi:hypothetical protein
MKIDGRCHCGYVTYDAEIDPEKVIICHCRDCQMLSGSAFRTMALSREGTFRLRSGQLKIYVKTADSGTKRAQSFCPECGTQIHSGHAEGGPLAYFIRAGTIRQRDVLVPKLQAWTRSALPWIGDMQAIPKIDKQQGVVAEATNLERAAAIDTHS